LSPVGHICQPTTYGDSGTHQGSLAHALPISRVDDSALALIVGLSGRLTDECKRRLIEIAQACLPSDVGEDEFDEIDERGV
jgi:hypothetical protein